MKDARTLPTSPASMRMLDMAMPRVLLKERVESGLTIVLHPSSAMQGKLAQLAVMTTIKRRHGTAWHAATQGAVSSTQQ
jgi:hypothetical protein